MGTFGELTAQTRGTLQLQPPLIAPSPPAVRPTAGQPRLKRRYFPSTEAHHHTVPDLVDRYIRGVLPQKSTSSIEMQTIQLRWRRQQLGQLAVAEVTPSVIAEQRDLLARGCHSPATVNRYLAA